MSTSSYVGVAGSPLLVTAGATLGMVPAAEAAGLLDVQEMASQPSRSSLNAAQAPALPLPATRAPTEAGRAGVVILGRFGWQQGRCGAEIRLHRASC
jgi:hypothetical protein